MRMDDLAKEIKRKISIRKTAMDNMGYDMDISSSSSIINISDNSDNEMQKLHSELYDNIREADQSKLQNGNPTITSRRKLGKLIIFIKRAIRKTIKVFLGWFIRPILEKQTYFNGKAVNSVSLMRQILILQEKDYLQKIKDLECEIVKLKNSDVTEKLIERVKHLEEKTAEGNNTINEYNKMIEKFDYFTDNHQQLNSATHDLDNKMKYVLNRLNVSCDLELLQKNNLDYFKFEDTFRGSRSSIKEVQSAYVPYFKHNSGGTILDIGCGRGEFLELMMDNEIEAQGVDIYEPFVGYCNERGFDAQLSDALSYLYSLNDCSLGGIFMSQVVEHLSNDYVIALINTAYRKLKPGCYFILETPNPDCIAAISEFNIDISHIKPVHFKALEFIFKEAHYTSVERYHTQQSLYPISAKHIDGKEISNIAEFNQGIDNINGFLFGYRDYTLIAKK